MILELADCLRGSIVSYSGIEDFIRFDIKAYPLYLIGLMYAFGLNRMWGSTKRWGRVSINEYRNSNAKPS
ncbi:hypothetical protein GCM10007941_17940 [Amphritea balenae]|nr:hypothetical protein GCM10007941_17940 [Amphritea balenae]